MQLQSRRWLLGLAAVVAVGSWSAVWLRPPKLTGAAALRAEPLPAPFEALKVLHQAPPPPRPGDWLAQHEEPGQSWAAYVGSTPVRASAQRRTIDLQPLGDFTAAQWRVVERTADAVGRFFQLPVRLLPALPAPVVPATAQRTQGGVTQWLSPAILKDVLQPRRADDALALVALTAVDLYPEEGWNFVFGQASLEERVGVWSLARLGDAEREPRVVLRRTVQTAVHELGHVLSLPHCVTYRCVMNGSNSLAEADQQPLEPCPVCLAKLTHSTGLEPRTRAGAWRELLTAEGLDVDAAELTRELERLPR